MTRGRQEVAAADRSDPGSVVHARWLVLGLWIALAAPSALAGPAEDAYIAGYVTAVLERQMDVKGSRITVKDGVVTVEAAGLPGSDREKLVATLSTIAGVVRVVVVDLQQPPATAPPAAAPLPTTAATPSGPAVEAEVPRRGLEVLPKGLLFAPLIADPRWPHFSAAYQRFHEDARLANAAPRQPGRDDLARAGPAGGERRDLGDRDPGRRLQPLRHGRAVERPRQLRLHRGLPVRVPGRRLLGAGALLPPELAPRRRVPDREPDRAREPQLRGRGPAALVRGDRLAPGVRGRRDTSSAATRRTSSPGRPRRASRSGAPTPTRTARSGPSPRSTSRTASRTTGRPTCPSRAGVQFEKLAVYDRKIQLLAEYFNGYSPNGQFYRDKVQYIGLGIHLYLY